MATSFQPNVHYTFGGPSSSTPFFDSRRGSGIVDNEDVSSRVYNSVTSRRGSRKSGGRETSSLADVVYSLRRRNSSEMDSLISSKLMSSNHATLIDWIRGERMSKLPAEGSSYDRVLSWAALFVEQLHTFDSAVEGFAGDSHLASQLVYGYCALLLELGEENASALVVMFSFFCACSVNLVNLLDRAELFTVSQEIKDQLVLALADLVTLVVCVATYFHKALSGMTSESVSIDIFSSFPGPIESFRNRCELVAGLMWRHQLFREGLDEASVSEIRSIKQWLEPEDPVLANITHTSAQSAQDREESSCLWMTPYLNRFLKSDKSTLVFSGKPGSGRTILSSVMVDQLQHPIGGVSYQPISISISSRISANTTPRSIAKSILSQLFAKRIGNVQLYQIISDAYDRCEQTADNDEYDNILWSAVEDALQASIKGAKELVLVVNGTDQASCGESAIQSKLKKATTNANNMKLVLLGSHQSSTNADQTAVNITPDLTFDDMTAVVRHALQSCQPFRSMSEEQREITVNRIAEVSDGSFLFAKLATSQIQIEGEKSAQKFAQSVDKVAKAGYSIKDFVSLHSSWLATVARPLSTRELSALLSIQVDKANIKDRDVDPRNFLETVAPLLTRQNGLVGIRHNEDKVLPSPKDRHLDITRRCLIYIKHAVVADHEPSVSPLDPNITGSLLEKFPLLDFSVRYWVDHIKKAFGCTTDDEFSTASKEIRDVMPTSTSVPLLATTIWTAKATPVQMTLYATQTRLYQYSTICQALFYRELQDSLPSKVIPVMYAAVVLSNDVLSPSHIVTMQLARFFLEATTNQVTESQTEIMVNRTRVLYILVESYKAQYGTASELYINASTELAQHYQIIKEEEKAKEIYSYLQQDNTTTEGTTGQWTSSQAQEDSLLVNLHGRPSKVTDDFETTLSLDEKEEDELISSSNAYDIDALISLAETYVSQGNLKLAETAYVEVWQRTSREFRLHRSAQWELKNLKAVLAYTNFLKKHNRQEEAASTLAGLWQEYEQGPMSNSSAVIAQFSQVAESMQSVGLSAMALNVYKHCAQYYAGTSGHNSSVYQQLQETIQTTSTHVMQTASSSSSSVTESSLKDMVFESINNPNQTTISAANTLIELYMSQHRWHDATKLIKSVLRGIWPSFFANSVQDVSAAPSKHAEFCISLAEHLSDCYHSRRRPSKEEDARNRLYHALRRDHLPGDKTLDRVTSGLLRLYKRTSQTDKIITLYQQLLDDYTKRLGHEHPTVIKTLWTLAELTSPRPVSVDYYRQIVNIINKDSDICKPEAFEPLLIVVDDLWNKERYTEAVQLYRVLFNTLKHQKVNAKLRDHDFVRTIFERYTHCLRVTHASTTVLHDVTTQYLNTCKLVFGATASITVQATLSLANICQSSIQYESEAVHLYESLLAIQSDAIDKDDIREILDSLEEKQTASVSSSSSSSLTSAQVDRAVTVRRQRLASMRSEYGWAHEESLSEMEEMASLYSKQGDFASVVSLLKDTAVEVLSNETSAGKLTAAAQSIASSYIASGQIQRGREFTSELYRQIVAKDVSHVKSAQFNVSSLKRQSLMFLAQLEYSLREDTSLTLNEIFSSLTTEYLYFEQLRSEIHSKTSSFQSVTAAAARLYGFLVSRDNQTTANFVISQLSDYFVAREGREIGVIDSAGVREFVVTIVKYFTTHSSQNFLRSIAIASYNRVCQLLAQRQYQPACDLALTSFKHIRANDGYSYLPNIKLAFKLGMAISGRDLSQRPDETRRKSMLEISSAIMKETIRVFKRSKVDLTCLGQDNLNNLIGLLDEQQDYHSLAWVLTTLWDNRETHTASAQPYFIVTLARMLVITRYMVGDHMAAVRLAEDIVYNSCRVHGVRHPNTFEMTVLLSQLYTSVALRYQSQKDGKETAQRYFKKAAALHENALRGFLDPSSMQFDYSADSSQESDASSSTSDEELGDEGKHVRQHFHLLKHAVERLGSWPKDYSEYSRLSAELFNAYPEDLKGVDGVDKWNLKNYGSGRAESSDDLVTTGLRREITYNLQDLGALAIPV
ncbi:hypothetical protein BDW42DRAFT_185851 [Aspergillus taichungensis]|uniref:Nephrocystin 3-like N-terminal domain-containing protein n=1 Tax=Aspergillus taichungensis TaxID=482145 RepID=A0A2J5HTK2_9EURO|nr:hypothetical protein BDW42DRAFT_185851 [Aspergillus taichungensis]